jgi:hypothetical protein
MISLKFSRPSSPLVALFLLGASELILIDISAPYIKAAPPLGNGLFSIFTVAFSILTAIVLFWASMKAQHRHGDGFEQGMMAGMSAGLKAALGITVLCLAAGLAGRGIARLMPYWVTSQGMVLVFAFDVAACALITVAYCAAGAGMGALSGIVLDVAANKGKETKKPIEKKAKTAA